MTNAQIIDLVSDLIEAAMTRRMFIIGDDSQLHATNVATYLWWIFYQQGEDAIDEIRNFK